MAATLNVSRFYDRLGKLHANFLKHRNLWGDASVLSLNRGPLGKDEDVFLKSITLHQYLFGYELPETILVLTESGNLYVIATKKKCEFLKPAVEKAPKESSIKEIKLLQRQKGDTGNELFEQCIEEAGIKDGDKVGIIFKERKYTDKEVETNGKEKLLISWEKLLTETHSMEMVECTPGISQVMSIKDETEIEMMKKSSILSNKVLKHGVIPRIEEVIDSELTVTHEQIAKEIDNMIEEPSQIKLSLPKEHVQSCYFPIVQSGGAYDIRISAQSTDKSLKYDIITVSFGARYQLYCSNIARTFLVDPPKYVSDTYETLLGMHQACLSAMIPGNPLKAVYRGAASYLKSVKKEELIKHLPKTLGFSVGVDFRDPSLLLNTKNQAIFRSGMLFSLTIGFADVELDEKCKANVSSKSAVKSLEKFALQIADTVAVTDTAADVLTKHSKHLTDISYTINDENDSDDEPREGDKAYALELSKEAENIINGQRSSSRLRKSGHDSSNVVENAVEREKRQVDVMSRKCEQRIREMARENDMNRNPNDPGSSASELVTYSTTKTYPDFVLPNQVKVDMSKECVIVPVCGNAIPFHISTIKNVVLPDPDANAYYLRINFYAAGSTLGKDTPVNMAKLVQKYAPYATFVREMTFRSLESHSLTQAYRQISELRKRVRQREQREQEEANLVQQERLVQTKLDRVPRLSDLTMRPVFAARKTQGNLESHTNGLRFRSSRGEMLDVMYNNVKHAIFQPCENEIMVLIHFHLKNPIMVGKKKQKDIQFFTEVIDASLQVDGRNRNLYDPDEVDDEQRERLLRKKLNEAFKDFCRKVEAVSKKNGFSIEFDIPYRDLGFTGTPNKEMVFVQPTLNCLVNLTETPFFVIDLSEVDHVHFERVTFMSKAIDMVLINKDFKKQPGRVDMIPTNVKDSIQEWLTDMELSYTEGPMNLNWKQLMNTVKDDERFYMDTQEDEVTPKDQGWAFLRLFGNDNDSDDEGEDGDSAFSGGEEEEEDEEDDSEEPSDSETDFDSEESEESDFDADEELEEQGMDWDDMEREAAKDDRKKSQKSEDDPTPVNRKRNRGPPPRGARRPSQAPKRRRR